jgi:hypothetical protein
MTEPIAEALDDTDYRLRLLWGLRPDRLNNGKFVATLTLAGPETTETSALHLDALRDLKSVNKHIVAATAAYPVLESKGELLATRLRQVNLE